MSSDLSKFMDEVYNCFELYGEKGVRNGNYQEIILKFKDSGVVFRTIWVNIKEPAGGKESKKNTGGKKSYIMLMKKEVDRLMAIDAEPEALGYIWTLLSNIQWNTGLLVAKRTKRPLGFDDMMAIFKRSRKKTAEVIGKLKNYGVLLHDEDGYKISRTLIKKGGYRREEKSEGQCG